MSFDAIAEWMSLNFLCPLSGGESGMVTDDEYINKLNGICGTSLPEEYQLFLRKMNEASLVCDEVNDRDMCVIGIEGSPDALGKCYAIDIMLGRGFDKINDIIESYISSSMPSKYICIARTLYGAAFVMDISNSGFGNVYYNATSQNHKNLPLIANSFSDFIERIRIFDDCEGCGTNCDKP